MVVLALLDFRKLSFWYGGEVSAFGKILPNQTVGVFVRAALAGTVRSREIDLPRV
jgi:hypothetical protein